MASPVAHLVTRLINAGVDPGEAAEIVAMAMLIGVSNAPRDAAADKRRAWDRDRKRKAKSGGNPPDSTGNHRNPVERAKKVSPKPPSKKPLPSPPIRGLMVSPETSTSRPAGPSVLRLAEQIRTLPPKDFRYSGVTAIAAALAPVLKEHAAADVLASCQAFYALPEHQRGFVPSVVKFLEGGRFRDFLPGPEPPAEPVTDAVRARRLQTFADTGEWKPAWGPRPEEQAA